MQIKTRRDFIKTAGTASALFAAGGELMSAGYRQNSAIKISGDHSLQEMNDESVMVAGKLGQDPKYKILWTWDYCVFWDDSLFWRGKGASGDNHRRSHFLKDYKRMVNFCSEHGINGIVIWGALRERNNGVEQFRELVNYGKQKRVRILPGVGVFGYGGVFYEGASPYSLLNWLQKHPELAAIQPDGNPYPIRPYGELACPSKKENLEWFKRSFEWLFKEFQIEGAQVEVGDYGVCHCDDCKKKRTGRTDSQFYIEDMLESYTAACEVAKKMNPDAWIWCETYSSFATPKTTEVPGRFWTALNDAEKKLLADHLPDNAVVGWNLDRAVPYEPMQEWSEKVYVPSKNNIARIHHGSQHAYNGNDEWAVYSIGEMVRKSRVCGVNGVSIFGEESPASPPNEANYLVFSEFSGWGGKNPNCDYKTFYAKTLDPLYGGTDMSLEWRRIFVTAHFIRYDLKYMLSWPWKNWGWEALEFPHFHRPYLEIGRPDLFDKVLNMSIEEKRGELKRLACEARDVSSKLSGESCRRWAWLENRLWREEFLFQDYINF